MLDRLIDHEPEVRRESPRSRNQVLRELKQSVRRDLENLLNTRVRCVPLPPELKELKQSLVNYGIPDLTGASLGIRQGARGVPPDDPECDQPATRPGSRS